MSREYAPEVINQILMGSANIDRMRREINLIVGVLVKHVERTETDFRSRKTTTAVAEREKTLKELRVPVVQTTNEEYDLFFLRDRGSIRAAFVPKGDSWANHGGPQIPAKFVSQVHTNLHRVVTTIAESYPELDDIFGVLIEAAEAA